jgi:hypothetical protein
MKELVSLYMFLIREVAGSNPGLETGCRHCFSVNFLSPSRQMLEPYLKIGRDNFLTYIPMRDSLIIPR